MRLSPFGMDTCCVCDAPTTHAGMDPETKEILPYCANDMRAVKQNFPEVLVLLYTPRSTDES